MSKKCYGCHSTKIYIEDEVFEEDYILQLYICDSCGVSNTRFEYYDD
jgi:protein-arginine kinase activator protein McsA